MQQVMKRRVTKTPISEHGVLNEAYDYEKQRVSFVRGLRVELGAHNLLSISGTASVNEEGKSIHAGDIYAQTMRTFTNIKALLASEGADWHDVIKTTCYLADMRDYEEFNRARNDFYDAEELDPYPSSTCIGALICRPDLRVEIDCLAVVPSEETI